MSPRRQDATLHAKARKRRYLNAQERLERDRRQAQHAATVLEEALYDLGLPGALVAEIEGRLRSQQKLLGKIVGVMFPPLFGCRTNSELCRVRGWDKNLPSRVLGVLPKRSWLKRLRRLGLEVLVPLWRDAASKSASTRSRWQWTWVAGEEQFYVMCCDTAISGPRLIRAWKRRHWIEYCFRTLKHLLATGACQVHNEDAYYGHLVLRLMGCFVLFYTSRVVCKGRLTMEDIIFGLKHYWRFVDCEALELKTLSRGMDEKAA
jgi:hypothetical protein